MSEKPTGVAAPRPLILYCAAALSGAAVMIVELTATRLFAPWFGASIYAWTNVVAVVLSALAAGYAVGGKAADASPSARTLGVALLVAAGLTSLSALLGPTIAAALAPDASGDPAAHLGALAVGSLIAGAAAFGPPLFLLGWTSPFVARLLGDAGVPAGAAAGRALAVSTFGSLIGTYLPAFLLLERFGSRGTILTAAGLLVLAATLLLGLGGMRRIGAATTVVILAAVATSATPLVPPESGATIVRVQESAYQYIQVAEVGGSNGLRYLNLALDEGRGEFHSRKATDGRPLTDAYYDSLAVLPDWITDSDRSPLEVLVVGGGAGTLRGLLRSLQGPRVRRITDVEIDPVVASMAPLFGGEPVLPDRVLAVDGRAALRAEGVAYDLIVLDAYTRQLAVPSHLGSREAFVAARERLTSRGVFAMNVSAADVDSELVQTLVRTLREVFPAVRAVPVAGCWNILLLCGPLLPPATATAARNDALDPVRSAFRSSLRLLPDPDPRLAVLTDDLAPLETLARKIK